MKRDNEIFDLIEKELKRQLNGIELIASENFVSENVLEAMGSVLTNKYAEGYPFKRYYGGCEIVDQTEQLAINRVKELFGAEYANVQPHSGAQANAAVMLATLKPGDKLLGLDLSHGGHLTHGSPVNYSGILYQPIAYGLNKETGIIDYEQMEALAREHKPKMIMAGASAYSRDWDYERIRKIADMCGATLVADISHPAGLIATGLLNNPFPHCHIVTSTTHKTLRGPRGGIILIGIDYPNTLGITTPKGEIKMMSAVIDSAVFPGTQGGPLEHIIAAKAVGFFENLQPDYKDYINKVKTNAGVLADTFINMGYKVISNGTCNHLMLIDLRSKFPDLTGKQAENTLVRANITINKNMVPFDSRSPFLASGIRIGTPAVTTRGLKEEEMKIIAKMIDNVLSNINNEAVIVETAARASELMKNYPLFA